MLLSPLNPLEDLGDYLVFSKRIHWLFCKNCGTRGFALSGEGEVVEKDLSELGIDLKSMGLGEPSKRELWHPKKPWTEGRKGYYLSINANTLEPGQEGLDLREWTEKKWICYLDCLDAKEDVQFERPQRGGGY